MNVKELMEILAKYDGDAKVELEGWTGTDGYDYAELYVDGNKVMEDCKGF